MVMAYNNLSVNSQQIKKFKIIQNAKIIIVVLVVAAIGVGAWFAYDYYQKVVSDLNGTTKDASIGVSTSPVTGTIEKSDTDVIRLDNSTSPQLSSSNEIPYGAVLALNSIESTGINGNPYIVSSLDTTSLPAGATITFDRATWINLDTETATIKANASTGSETKNTNITFSQSSGSWKVVGYSLN